MEKVAIPGFSKGILRNFVLISKRGVQGTEDKKITEGMRFQRRKYVDST